MFPPVQNTALGVLERFPAEIRIKIYHICMNNNRIAVRHPYITKFGPREATPAFIIVRPTPLALVSRQLHEEIHAETKNINIHDIALHEVSIHSPLHSPVSDIDPKRIDPLYPPPSMEQWKGAKHILIKIIIENEPGTTGEFSRLTNDTFCLRLIDSFPNPETAVFKLQERVLDEYPGCTLAIVHRLTSLRHARSTAPILKHAIVLRVGANNVVWRRSCQPGTAFADPTVEEYMDVLGKVLEEEVAKVWAEHGRAALVKGAEEATECRNALRML